MTPETWVVHLSSYLPVLAEPMQDGQIGVWKDRSAGSLSLRPPDTQVSIDELERCSDWQSLVCERLDL